MGNLLNDHPVVGALAVIAAVWAMTVVSALVFFLFENPESHAATAIAGGMSAVFSMAFLNIRKLKGLD